jgi:hypothetical protein
MVARNSLDPIGVYVWLSTLREKQLYRRKTRRSGNIRTQIGNERISYLPCYRQARDIEHCQGQLTSYHPQQRIWFWETQQQSGCSDELRRVWKGHKLQRDSNICRTHSSYKEQRQMIAHIITYLRQLGLSLHVLRLRRTAAWWTRVLDEIERI